MTELLRTKLHIPQSPPHHLPRPSLIALLAIGLQRRLTLVSAPAGFGKTTLVAAWLHQLLTASSSRATPAIGWVTLDSHDNDPQRFGTYLAAALGFPEQQTGRSAPVESRLIPLLNHLVANPHDHLLVLDDYHLIENDEIDAALTFLVENAPPTLHIFLTTRIDPDLPLHRWRARQQLVELRAHELRFSRAESATLLQELLQLPITSTDVALLDEHTEGWIAALQMVGQSLRGRSTAAIGAFVNDFHGSHRFVLDYLVEEVLHQQQPAIQHFLLQTSILDRLTAPLCDAMIRNEERSANSVPLPSPLPSSQAILEQLEAQNLFTFALDDTRQWFRYHHLFADFLRVHLQATAPEEIPLLHRRAAQWYAAAELFDEAIDHALQGDAVALAAEWVAQIASGLLQRGEVLTLKRLLGRLPAVYVQQDYRLALTQAWAATAVIEAREPTPDFDHLDGLIRKEPTITAERRVDLLGQVLAMRTTWAVSHHQITQALHYGEAALATLPDDARVMRDLITLQLGNAHRVQGEIGAALAAYQTLIDQGAAVADALIIYIGHYHGGRLLRMQGQLLAAKQIYTQGIGVNTQLPAPTPLVGLAHLGLAEVLWDSWDLPAALAQCELAVEQCRVAGMVEGTALAYDLLARIHWEQQHPQAALDAQVAAQRYFAMNKDADAAHWMALYQLHNAVMRKDVAALAQQVGEIDLRSTMAADLHSALGVMVAQAYLLLHAPAKSLAMVDLLRQWAGRERLLLPIDLLVIQAIAQYEQGQFTAATAALREALQLAAGERALRVFVVHGAWLQPIWQKAQHQLRDMHVDFVETVATYLSVASPSSSSASQSAPGLVETLSAREREILSLIAAGQKNQEIADVLMISLNTVRYHTKNLYGKLGVNKRTQAVARAQELGLLA
ncbi:MAG: hypothetical protein KDE19_15635 [Caldilineaceae bacterium]|nr:hypothetical protein [Caldilineaceae bacterium]